jgi:hypothetical protein
MNKNLIKSLIMTELVVLIFLVVQPVNRLSYVVIEIFIVLNILVLLLLLLWGKRRIFISMMVLLVIPFLPLLNQSNINMEKLTKIYVKNLKSYKSTKYVWGGENSLGIDCSGLPRKSMRSALFEYGYRYFNGKALNNGLWMIVNDASANEMLKGYSGLTVTDGLEFKINDLNKSAKDGDMAITSNGVHCMVYLNNNVIIQADPGRDMVVTDKIPYNDGWYNEKVKLIRWSF